MQVKRVKNPSWARIAGEKTGFSEPIYPESNGRRRGRRKSNEPININEGNKTWEGSLIAK